MSAILPLDMPLRDMLAIWCDELAPADRIDVEAQDRARHRVRSTLPIRAALRERMVLCAAEGITKTSAIIAEFPRIIRAIGTGRRLGMFAFADYENAEEKCAAFNDLWSGRGYHAVVWRSWSRWYAETAERLGRPVLTEHQAVMGGHTARWRLIEERQPEVITEMRQEHRAMWDEIGTAQPVVMTVHDVAHRWAACGRSRRMFSPAFFDDVPGTPEVWVETKLALLTHDEIADTHFIDALSAGEMAWIAGLQAVSGPIWTEGRLAEQMKAYDAYVAREGSLMEFRHAAGLMGRDWEEVTLGETSEYPAEEGDRFQVYSGAVGSKWYVSPRSWWAEGDGQVADRIVILTTETVSSRVAARAMPDLIVDTSNPADLGRDLIDVEVSRGATSKNASALADPYRRDGWFVIANKLGSDDGVLSPMAARGRNDLADRNIVQIVTMHHPSRYERLQALNAWLGSDDLVLLAHIDQINQTAGRNRGFRNRGGTEHLMLIHPRLYRLLQSPKALPYLRYQVRPRMTRAQRNNLN